MSYESSLAEEAEEHGHASVPELAVGVVIGRSSEFFDFFVYAIASVLVFPRVMFPFASPLDGVLLSFAVFSLAFVARPFGTLIFTEIDRRFGRGIKLTVALFLLGCATAGIAFMPDYSVAGGYAIVILCGMRIAQGLALGGAWDGLASLLAMNAPREERGWYAMIPQLGAPVGLFVASALFVYLVTGLSEADFLEWGWRYPFFVAFAINVVALFARLRIVVTEEYEEQFRNHELRPSSVRETVAAEGSNILIGAFTPLATFALFHLVSVFPLSWVYLSTNDSVPGFLAIEIGTSLVGLAAVLGSGALADRFGRRRLLFVCALAIAVFALLGPVLLDAGQSGEFLFMVLGFGLLGLSFGQSSGAVASRFDRRYRYTASALTSDLAWLVGAGFAPLVALLLASQFGLFASGLYLLSGAICSIVALILSQRLEIRDEE
ncbi:MFS transporter [Amaricoccus solimangrovi]|uniref:MHS family MFS transporter n=1 Tax=Amaricoccus solimangrovi TaxID=2589815 RepID=A0A501WGB7_9RHOB|nr:MFS transporter [Amaricoccus solimangrovi]TPE48933.1 MHS family MFS transporter [Amaricoccus solimangrovi]